MTKNRQEGGQQKEWSDDHSRFIDAAQREQAVRVAELEKEQAIGEQTASFERDITITVRGTNDAPVAQDDTGSAVEAGGVLNGTFGHVRDFEAVAAVRGLRVEVAVEDRHAPHGRDLGSGIERGVSGHRDRTVQALSPGAP